MIPENNLEGSWLRSVKRLTSRFSFCRMENGGVAIFRNWDMFVKVIRRDLDEISTGCVCVSLCLASEGVPPQCFACLLAFVPSLLVADSRSGGELILFCFAFCVDLSVVRNSWGPRVRLEIMVLF